MIQLQGYKTPTIPLIKAETNEEGKISLLSKTIETNIIDAIVKGNGTVFVVDSWLTVTAEVTKRHVDEMF
jgi:hypothetical protein